MNTREKLAKNRETYARKAEEVRRDWTMSDAAKRQKLSTLYAEASATYFPARRRVTVPACARGSGTPARPSLPPPRSGRTRRSTCSPTGTPWIARPGRTTRGSSPRCSRGRRSPGTGPWRGPSSTAGTTSEAARASIVQSYFSKYPEELPGWDAFMGAATEHNKLETMGLSVAVGVPAPERPRELGALAPAGVHGT